MGLEKILNNFKSKKILVIGDAIIDSYLWGEINRMSPEAPVPVVDGPWLDQLVAPWHV